MRYLNSVLQPGETIVHRGSIHWIIHWQGAALLLAGALLWIDAIGPRWLFSLSLQLELPAAYLCLAGGLILLARSHFIQWTTEIAVTDRRVIQKSGFIARQTAEMNINQVERVEVLQSILGRILNYGTIHIHGSGMGLEGLENVADPLKLRTSITAR